MRSDSSTCRGTGRRALSTLGASRNAPATPRRTASSVNDRRSAQSVEVNATRADLYSHAIQRSFRVTATSRALRSRAEDG